MSKPDIVPDKSVSGIAVDPRTLERVIPETRRADGSVRKERKIRPGFTPQEDVSRFRSSRQKAMDANKLPPGHIPGWTPPPSRTKPTPAVASKPGAVPGSASGETKPVSKSASKNAKRKAKKQAEREKVIQENWEDSDSDSKAVKKDAKSEGDVGAEANPGEDSATNSGGQAKDKAGEALAEDFEKLDVQ